MRHVSYKVQEAIVHHWIVNSVDVPFGWMALLGTMQSLFFINIWEQ